MAIPPTSGEEGLRHPEGKRRPRPRIETLADLIFGLSLGIGSIALLTTSATTPGEINKHILVFAFTFLFLITSWLIYTTYMSVLPVETKAVTFLNICLLLLVALIPYLLNSVELGVAAIRDYSSTLFAVDLSGILVILAFFAHVLSLEEKNLVPPEVIKLFRNGRNRMFILAVLMVISTAPQFWELTFLDTPLRIYLWSVPLISYWVGRAVRPESRTYKLS